MNHIPNLFRFLLIMTLFLAFVSPALAAKDSPGYQTGFIRWRAAENGFQGWALTRASLAGDGTLNFAPDGEPPETDPYPPDGYYGRNFYNGSTYYVGEAVSPEMPAPFAFTEAIASWNAATPTGTWIETLMRVQFGSRWSKWYNLGIWAADYSTIQRHSVRLQGDADGYVAVDTLVVSAKKTPVSAYQLKVRLFSANESASPNVHNLSLAFSTSAEKKAVASSGNPADWNTLLAVPECSQMVYPDGGNVWCSPTSTSMVLGYWENDTGPCEPRVRAAVDGVYDWVYDGHGNWPFNTAYAATHGMEGYVARFTSLTQAEPWIKAGVPVITSIAWGSKDLTGAAVPSSNGHLMVLVGFDADGNPVLNDPAAASDEDVQRTYLRSEFEPLWLTSSGGTVYLIYPVGWAVPEL